MNTTPLWSPEDAQAILALIQAGHEVQSYKDGVRVATGQGVLTLRPGDTIPTPGEMAQAE